MVAASDGLLAPNTGSEKYLSVAGGHFAAFCKAGIAGCKSSEPSIANAAGCVDIEKLKKDPVFKKLLEDGWPCRIIHSRAEERHPGLADFNQRACNATDSVATDCSELEVLMAMVNLLQECKDMGTQRSIGRSAWMLQQVVTPLEVPMSQC